MLIPLVGPGYAFLGVRLLSFSFGNESFVITPPSWVSTLHSRHQWNKYPEKAVHLFIYYWLRHEVKFERVVDLFLVFQILMCRVKQKNFLFWILFSPSAYSFFQFCNTSKKEWPSLTLLRNILKIKVFIFIIIRTSILPLFIYHSGLEDFYFLFIFLLFDPRGTKQQPTVTK